MTTITFKLDQNDLYTGFTCEGHAGYKRFGKDIVCSAISALTITFVNSIDEMNLSLIEVEEDSKSGYMDVDVIDYSSDEIQLLFKSLNIGLKGIEKSYSKYVKLTNRR